MAKIEAIIVLERVSMNWNSLPRKTRRALQLYFNLYLGGKAPILVFTPGRVGSNSIYQSLRNAGNFAIHLHHLADKAGRQRYYPGTTAWTFRHVIRSDRHAKVVTLIRDPIAALISEYFSKLGVRQREMSMTKLNDVFRLHYFEEGRILQMLDWYEHEYAGGLGLDIWSLPFDADRQYGRYTTDKYDVLLLRSELSDGEKSSLIAELLGVSRFEIQRVRTAENRHYYERYREFKRQLRLADEHLDLVYESRVARKFLGDAERQDQREKWRRGDGSVVEHSRA